MPTFASHWFLARHLFNAPIILFCLVLSLLLTPACRHKPEATKRAPLNSERIAERFGSYGIEVLSQSPERRVSNLYSTQNGIRTCRTFAIVQFERPIPAQLREIHESIIAGESLGATLKHHGWAVSKSGHTIGRTELTNRHATAARLMNLRVPVSLAIHRYELRTSKGSHDLAYCQIAEVHHPDYLSVEDLTSIYPKETSRIITPPSAQLSHIWQTIQSELNRPSLARTPTP